MLGKMIDLIGRNARGFAAALIFLVAVNAVFQTYTHKTTALTAWKGGGFGMYTEPHVDARSVWLEFRQGDQKAWLRLWPEAAEMARWRGQLSVNGSVSVGRITAMAEALRYYPRAGQADILLDLAARIRWQENLRGSLEPQSGKTFDEADLTVQVFENAFDIHNESIRRVPIFAYDGGR